MKIKCHFPSYKCSERMINGDCWDKFVESCYDDE